MNRCESCKYYEIIFSPYLRRRVPACCLPKEANGKCKYCNKNKK